MCVCVCLFVGVVCVLMFVFVVFVLLLFFVGFVFLGCFFVVFCCCFFWLFLMAVYKGVRERETKKPTPIERLIQICSMHLNKKIQSIV